MHFLASGSLVLSATASIAFTLGTSDLRPMSAATALVGKFGAYDTLGPDITIWTAENDTSQSIAECASQPEGIDEGESKATAKRVPRQPLECEDDDDDEFLCSDCGGGEWDPTYRHMRCKGV